MKLMLVTATLLLSVTFAELISNELSQTLNCYGSNGWKNWHPTDMYVEKEQCSSRCYAAHGKSFLIPKYIDSEHSLLNTWMFESTEFNSGKYLIISSWTRFPIHIQP